MSLKKTSSINLGEAFDKFASVPKDTKQDAQKEQKKDEKNDKKKQDEK